MTYAIGIVDEQGVTLRADTAVTLRHNEIPNKIPGACKVMPLSRDVSIAYAGNVDVATAYLKDLRFRGFNGTDEDLVKQIWSSESVRKYGVDYLVAVYTTDGHRLYKISAEGIASGAAFYWIGDQDAARLHTTLMDQFDNAGISAPANLSERQRIERSYSAVLSGDIPGVGGFSFAIGSTPGRAFQFQMVTSVEIGERILGPEAAALQFGLPDGQQFIRSIVVPPWADVAVVGVYVGFADMGWVYRPYEGVEVEQMRNVTFHDFWRALHRETGMCFLGCPVGRIALGRDDHHVLPVELAFATHEHQ
jgi:hypothetical protein